MTFKLIEGLRERSVDRLFGMEVFKSCWPIWYEQIAKRTSNLTDADAIYQLGGQLREIFFLTSSGERGQGDVSGGGAAWEGLVCWYLNLVLTGTTGVVVKQNKNLMRSAILQAMSVNYKNRATNTESDLSGIVFPNDPDLKSKEYSKNSCDEYIKENFHKISLHNLQCKTNWNDNAQIPMLWDMIYQFRGVKHKNISIGSGGYSLNDLKDFSYSFITMPSQKKEIKAGSMAVQRVEALSGGNYWGMPTRSGVAASISEIFRRVFDEAFDGHVQAHIKAMIENGFIKPPYEI